MGDQVKFVLDETQIPKAWYNLAADLPKPLAPVLHPGTKQPIGPGGLEGVDIGDCRPDTTQGVVDRMDQSVNRRGLSGTDGDERAPLVFLQVGGKGVDPPGMGSTCSFACDGAGLGSGRERIQKREWNGKTIVSYCATAAWRIQVLTRSQRIRYITSGRYTSEIER